MCFCSFMLCNSAPAASPQVRCSSLVTLLALTAFWTIFYSLQGPGDDILCSRSNYRPDQLDTSGLCSSTGSNGSREKWQMRRRKRRRKMSAKFKYVDPSSRDQQLIPNSAPGCYSSSIVRMKDEVSCHCSLKLLLRLVDQKLMLPSILSEIRWHSSSPCNCDVTGSPLQTQFEPTQTSTDSPWTSSA